MIIVKKLKFNRISIGKFSMEILEPTIKEFNTRSSEDCVGTSNESFIRNKGGLIMEDVTHTTKKLWIDDGGNVMASIELKPSFEHLEDEDFGFCGCWSGGHYSLYQLGHGTGQAEDCTVL
jgi:hypothetical protein